MMDVPMPTRLEGGYTVVTPQGEIDLSNVQAFREVLSELIIQGHVRLLVDLDETTFIDSLGFGALVAARRKAHAFRGSLGIVCSNARLLHLFKVTGLDRVFTITTTVASQPSLGVTGEHAERRSPRPAGPPLGADTEHDVTRP